jgi:hypothetical protein
LEDWIMRKVLASLAAVAMVAALGVSLRAESKTVKGEVIDIKCQTKKAENVGAAHADCALSCAKRGAAEQNLSHLTRPMECLNPLRERAETSSGVMGVNRGPACAGVERKPPRRRTFGGGMFLVEAAA